MRNRNLDLLRVIACLMVVIVHVGTLYGMSPSDHEPDYYFIIGNIFHSFPRTPVPLFVMISGGLLLSNPENENVKSHYIKAFKRLIIPTFFFSLGYTLLSIMFGYIEQGSAFDWLFPVKSWILGWPYYHMWYMYMIIGCYAVTPWLIRLHQRIGNRFFAYIGILFLLVGLINYQIEVLWPFKFIFYLGYFIMGYSLKEWVLPKVLSWRVCLVSSILILVAMVAMTHHRVLSGVEEPFYFLSSLSVTVMLSAVLMYISFINMPAISLNVSQLARQTFYIYLFHAGVLDILDFIIRGQFRLNPNPIWYLPFMVIAVFIISLQLSKGIEGFLNFSIRRRINSLEGSN